MSFDVYAMCNPLYDIQAEITDDLLRKTGFDKGGMCLIDESQQRALVATIYDHIVNAESGGSGANTVIGVSQLGGTACYSGKLAKDEHGDLYAASLRSKQIELLSPPGDGTTGISVVLITPDAERTMCTYLGICRELCPEDIDIDALSKSKYLYVTGYLWDTDSQKAAVLHAMISARTHGVKVSLSLSDPFCVNRHKAEFLQIAAEYVDLLIGNQEEMQELTGTGSPEEAILATSELCDMAVVTIGARGSIIRDGQSLIHIAPETVIPIDTTGAGDMYAAGILYGVTHGLGLPQTGLLASRLAATVVSTLGPRLDSIPLEILSSY